MKRIARRCLVAGVCVLTLSMVGHGAVRKVAPIDITEAKELCDELPLQPVEGLWDFPDENMTVMVMRGEDASGNTSAVRYAVTVVETPDVRLIPGDTIGWIEASVDPKLFRMTLYTRKNLSTLMQPANILARIADDDRALQLKVEKWSLKLSRISFLPSFWRSIKLQHDDPLKQLPVGMRRVYPLPEQLPSESREIRYL